MTPAQLAGRLYEAQQQAVRLTTEQLAALWGSVSVADIDGSWAQVLVAMSNTVALGQLRAATLGPAYLAAVLSEQELQPTPEAAVGPSSFVGYTAAGMPLDYVLGNAPIVVKQSLLKGADVVPALESGLRFIQLVGATEVADAGRGSVEAGMRLEPQIAGYERRVSSRACSRCMVLSGKFFKYNEGFDRHPGCDCVHVALTQKDYTNKQRHWQTPREMFDSLSEGEQNSRFTVEGARAIRSGADPSSVVNSRWQHSRRGNPSGMSTPGSLYTTAGTTVRSQFGRQEKLAGRVTTERVTSTTKSGQTRTRTKTTVVRPRLSPQGVARIAGNDHALYIRLLRENAYIT